MNPLIMFQIVTQAMTMIPKIVEAIQTIMASPAAHTVEDAFQILIHHNTAGGPNAAALSEDAPKVKVAMPAPVIDFQAPRG